MSFNAIANQPQATQLLQRSLDRGRLGHAYLFTGDQMGELEAMAKNLAKTINCENPPLRGAAGLALDCCDQCLACRKIEGDIHPDIQWLRPESKIRIISVDQIRDLMHDIYLKPTEARFKVAVIVAADRLNAAAANAFLKTLEEPPSNSVIVLLTANPQRLLETILSRCLRLSFAGDGVVTTDDSSRAWLEQFTALTASGAKSLLGRYTLLGSLSQQLAGIRGEIEKELSARSPIEHYPDAEPALVEKWETELSAAIEAEYRRRRMELLQTVQWWLRDIWLRTLDIGQELLTFPDLAGASERIAARLKPEEAMSNLEAIEKTQRILHTNAQEALVLEVGLLGLKL